jgi:NAD(P)-dependent dehydrogenase (short-subunit alcohol dehydrogenase family)
VIADELAGKRIAVTGATGFLGTALVERLLRSVPGCSVAVLVRPGRRQSAAERVRREILRNDCFNRLRDELGDRFDAEMAERLRESVWTACGSWYVNAEGRVTNNWPGSHREYVRRTRTLELADYVTTAPVREPVAADGRS